MRIQPFKIDGNRQTRPKPQDLREWSGLQWGRLLCSVFVVGDSGFEAETNPCSEIVADNILQLEHLTPSNKACLLQGQSSGGAGGNSFPPDNTTCASN